MNSRLWQSIKEYIDSKAREPEEDFSDEDVTSLLREGNSFTDEEIEEIHEKSFDLRIDDFMEWFRSKYN
jgi:hypothetical protein